MCMQLLNLSGCTRVTVVVHVYLRICVYIDSMYFSLCLCLYVQSEVIKSFLLAFESGCH